MPGLALMRRPHRRGKDKSSVHMRSTSLPPKRLSAKTSESKQKVLESLGHSDRAADGDSHEHEPTWFSHAFNGGQNPAKQDGGGADDDDSCSMESMELASGSEFRLRPTTTPPGSSSRINNMQRNITTSNNQASVSSITLGSNPLIPSSKFVPTLVSNNDIEDDCEESEDEQSKSSISKRTRGRSLGIPFSRKNKDKKSSKDDGREEEGNSEDKQQLDDYLSKKSQKVERKNELRGRSQSARERSRQRDRSRSIVRDMRTFLHSMDDVTSATSTAADTNAADTSDRSGKDDSIFTGTTCRTSLSDQNESPPLSPTLSHPSRAVKADKNSFFPWNKKCKDSDLGEMSEEQLIRELHETNLRNEGTIEQLREELADLTNERNAFRNNSERLMEVMGKQKEELQNEMHNERNGFATITNCQKREIEVWRRKANKLYKKVKMLDAQARERERVLERYNEDLGMEGMMEREERLRTLEQDIERILNNNPNAPGNMSFKSYESTGLSSLPSVGDIESRFSSMAKKYEAQIKHLESQNKTYQREITSWKEKYEEVQDEKDDEVAMVRVLENKLAGCRIIIESMKEEDESVAASVNDELVAKLGDVAEENGQLLARCNRLERELEAAKAKEADGRKLVAASKASIEEATRKMDLAQQRNEESLSTILTLRTENKKLRGSLSGDSRHAKTLVNQLRRSLVGDANVDENMTLAVTSKVNGKDDDEIFTIEEVRAENKELHKSLEDAIKLAEQLKGKMNAFVKTHDATIKDYKEKIDALTDELKHGSGSKESWEVEKAELSAALVELKEVNSNLNSLVISSVRDEITQEQLLSSGGWGREKKEMVTMLDALKLENENLRVSMKEMNGLVETAEECAERLTEENSSLQKERWSFEQDLMSQNETIQYLREEIKNANTERGDAYETCKILQQEINMLRQSISDSKERTEVLMSLSSDDDDSSNGNKEKLDALIKANDQLNKELKQKNEALEAVRTVLENMKEDQATIKKTIITLRQENTKLKQGLKDDDGSTDNSNKSAPPPPSRGICRSKTPPPPKKQSSTELPNNTKVVAELESKVKRVENENMGLRDANSTLSAKLFDEMEKTDALRVANDGLAARICKLVTFIQENPQGKQKLIASGSNGSTSKKSSKNPVVTPSPHSSITLKKSSSNPVVTPMPIKQKKSRQGS